MVLVFLEWVFLVSVNSIGMVTRITATGTSVGLGLRNRVARSPDKIVRFRLSG